MSIHYENYKTFSKGQGYVGSACRTKSAQATTSRWFACDCPSCKLALLGREVVSDDGAAGTIEEVYPDRVYVSIPGQNPHKRIVSLKELDTHWGPK